MTLPPGPYRLILADPPWAFRTHTSAGRTPTAKLFNEVEDHYDTLSLEELAALPVAGIAAPDSLLAMWVVGSHIDAALALGAAWGFAFRTDLFYWAKQKLIDAAQIDLFTGDIAAPKISMGYHTRKQIEPCLLFARGKGLPVLGHGVRQLILSPPRQHSRKPDEQYARLEALYGRCARPDGSNGRIELFSRTQRAGWDAWGNEVGKYPERPEPVSKGEEVA